MGRVTNSIDRYYGIEYRQRKTMPITDIMMTIRPYENTTQAIIFNTIFSSSEKSFRWRDKLHRTRDTSRNWLKPIDKMYVLPNFALYSLYSMCFERECLCVCFHHVFGLVWEFVSITSTNVRNWIRSLWRTESIACSDGVCVCMSLSDINVIFNIHCCCCLWNETTNQENHNNNSR